LGEFGFGGVFGGGDMIGLPNRFIQF